jgi:type II secretory pathway component GspD/PulD (secretin)
VTPGDGSVIIASDDVEALDQLESLLRALSQRPDRVFGDYLIHPLQNASAPDIAEILRRLFSEDASRGRGGPANVVVVSDQRLNAVIVHASRAERTVIAGLIEALDSGEAIESLATMKPKLIPVRNTRASRIASVVREVYKAQLTSGGGRPQIPVPAQTPAPLAAIIQQINATNAGPALTLGLDENINALVVMAPTPLLTEITQLVASLDDTAARDSYRSIRVVPLRKTNSKQMQQALEAALKQGTSRKPSP